MSHKHTTKTSEWLQGTALHLTQPLGISKLPKDGIQIELVLQSEMNIKCCVTVISSGSTSKKEIHTHSQLLLNNKF